MFVLHCAKTSRKRHNTALHYAVSQNQQGFLINFLLSKGANSNIVNANGYTPVMLAVLSCSTTTEALEKLIHAGADINIPIKARDGRWLRAVDLAVQHHNYKAEQLLRSSEQYVNTNTILCTSTAVVNEERGIAKCSICNVIVKFPSRMSFLEIDQKLTEEAAATTTTNEQEDESIHTNNAPTKKEI